MFHVKQFVVFLLTTFLLTGFVNSQGKYTYRPVSFSVKLPVDTSVLNPLERSEAYQRLSQFEKEFVYNLNFVRRFPKVFSRTAVEPYLVAYPILKPTFGSSLLNELDHGSVVKSLVIDQRLVSLAKAHARDIGSHNIMSHKSSTGETTQQRFEKAGVGCGSECINMASPVSPLEVLISLLIDYNVPDYGHRKSLLNPRMSAVGVGVANGTDGTIQYTVVDLGCE